MNSPTASRVKIPTAHFEPMNATRRTLQMDPSQLRGPCDDGWRSQRSKSCNDADANGDESDEFRIHKLSCSSEGVNTRVAFSKQRECIAKECYPEPDATEATPGNMCRPAWSGPGFLPDVSSRCVEPYRAPVQFPRRRFRRKERFKNVWLELPEGFPAHCREFRPRQNHRAR